MTRMERNMHQEIILYLILTRRLFKLLLDRTRTEGISLIIGMKIKRESKKLTSWE